VQLLCVSFIPGPVLGTEDLDTHDTAPTQSILGTQLSSLQLRVNRHLKASKPAMVMSILGHDPGQGNHVAASVRTAISC
jgi:hypothetical protein